MCLSELLLLHQDGSNGRFQVGTLGAHHVYFPASSIIWSRTTTFSKKKRLILMNIIHVNDSEFLTEICLSRENKCRCYYAHKQHGKLPELETPFQSLN